MATSRPRHGTALSRTRKTSKNTIRLQQKKQPRHQTAKNGFRSSDGCKNGVTKPFCTYPQKPRSIKNAPYSGRQQRRSVNAEKTTISASAQNTKKPRQKRKNNNTKNRKIHRKILRYSEPEQQKTTKKERYRAIKAESPAVYTKNTPTSDGSIGQRSGKTHKSGYDLRLIRKKTRRIARIKKRAQSQKKVNRLSKIISMQKCGTRTNKAKTRHDKQ